MIDRTPNGFRMPGILEVTAQSPNDTSTLVCARTFLIFTKSSSFDTAPSTSVMSTSSGKSLRSTSGLYTRSIFWARSSSRSSMSRKDMWQPEQPSSHTVASVGLRSLVTGFTSHHGQIRQKLSALGHLGHRSAFLAQCAGGTNLDALSATGAAFRFAPRLGQVSDHQALGAASHHVPGVRALNLLAHANTARAENAAILIQHETIVTGVHRQVRINVGEADVIYPQMLRQPLHITVAVRSE